jgi:hypothetical protein
MPNRTWKETALAVPGVGVSMLPKAICVAGKFWLDSATMTYAGVGLLVLASVWNVIPRRANVCSCFPADAGSTSEGI